MEKEIYDTKKKQEEREKSFVFSPSRCKRIEKIMNEVLEDICQRLENDDYRGLYWGDHNAVLDVDEYYKGENSSVRETISFWIANGETSLHFYEHDLFGEWIPDEYRTRLWQLLHDVKNANSLRMSYKDYLQHKEDKKTQEELEKQKEIEEAKKVLEKYKD